MIFLFLLLPLLSYSSTSAEIGAYSDFIWRGTTFSENRPAVQVELEKALPHDFYFAGFVSNAEFSDPGLHESATVTSEVDTTIGKRFYFGSWVIQAYYSKFFFPGAGVFDTDEWNLQFEHHGFTFEFSLLDDYFGYHARNFYSRLTYEWIYKDNLEGSLSVGYNTFDRPKGSIRRRDGFETLDGAGNTNYFDVFWSNRKTLENQNAVEFAVNWTDRREYSVENDEISKEWARDFALIVAYIVPFEI